MPSTTTTTSPPGTVSAEAARLRKLNHLSDYELYHSDTQSQSPSASKPSSSVQGPRIQRSAEPSGLQRALNNPEDWPDNHRRIPQYRPINRELDQSQRRVYQNNGERMFLTVMFTGVRVNAANRVWNATLGRINRNWFEYKVGGEW
ncbi:hypothetical protein BGZ60DRAFT_206094 [Tricladium varicosporioides]|nr:hypothetical protein BGZ60DRAFT_206094 [Hymenoscyphus varicosporioides]